MPTVKLYANLRKLAGTKELSITGGTVGAVLNELIKRHPPVGDAILENGELRQHIVVTLNGHNVTDLNLTMMEQDVIAIFPPIAGG
jgi:MoaD family protein